MPRSEPKIEIRRIYDSPVEGYRVLVDRLWPRGVSKAAARLDEWPRHLAPSAGLRKWFGHDPARWEEFRARYRGELAAHPDELERLRQIARRRKLVLLFAAKSLGCNHAIVLREVLSSITSRG